MARGLSRTGERRASARVAPEQSRWIRAARLRPGQEVQILNLGAGGALVESSERMKPGARTELQLGGAHRLIVRGAIGRCRVSALEPVRYEAAIIFEEPLEPCGQ